MLGVGRLEPSLGLYERRSAQFGLGLPNHYGRFERCPRQSLLSLFR
jgi:hypothetical protein